MTTPNAAHAETPMSTRQKIRHAVDSLNDCEDAVIAAREKLASAWTVFGKTMRECREAKGLSLREVAKRIKVSAPYLSDVELGRRTMTDDNVEAYMGIFEIDWNTIRERIQRFEKQPIKLNQI